MNLADCTPGLAVEHRHPCGTIHNARIIEALQCNVLIRRDDTPPGVDNLDLVNPTELRPLTTGGQCGVLG